MDRETQPSGDPLLSIAEAARQVGVHPNTIRRAIRCGSETDRLVAWNVSTRRRPLWKIYPADLERWVKRSPAASLAPARPMTRTTPGKSRHFKL